ncbi:MAG: PKD domain-containing protein [Planctomycetes bacterium]|nr:PKD domain-containing protein [Planctomycetota bacterium]
MPVRLVASLVVLLAGIWAVSCSSGLGNDPRRRAPAAASANPNLPVGLDLGLVPTGGLGDDLAIAGAVLPAIGATPQREVLFVAFTTPAPANDGDGAGTPLSRDATTDANGASDVFVALVSAQDVERRAFSQSLAGKFRHPRCATCHSMQAADTLAFASSPQAHAGPPPGPGFPNNQPEVCAPCHVTSSTFPVVGWQAPAASFDIRSKTVLMLSQMAQNAPADEDEHFVTDKRVLWALDSGILPQVGGRNGVADDDHDGVFQAEDIDGVPRTVPGGSVAFLHEIEAWEASGKVVTAAAAVKDVTLVSRSFGTNNAGNGASRAPALQWVPNPGFDPANAAATNPIGTLFVAFESDASNLVAGDGNGATDVFRAAIELRAEQDAVGTSLAGGLNLQALNTATILCSARNGLTAPGNGAAQRPSLGGANAEFIAFESVATNLVAGFVDGNGPSAADVYLRSVGASGTGTLTQLVSHTVGNSAIGGNGASERPALAAGGGAIAFESTADDLIASDGNGVRDVFAATTAGGSPFAKVRASVTDTGGEGSGGDSRNASVHFAAGRVRVAFESDKTNLDAAKVAATNVFLFDGDAGTTKLLNQRLSTSFAEVGAAPARRPAFLPDGSAIAFVADANNLDVLRPDTNRGADVFLVETEQIDAGRVLPFRISVTTAEAASANGDSGAPVVGSFAGSVNFPTGFAAYRTAATNLGTSDTTDVMLVFLNETSGILVDFEAVPATGTAPLEVQFQDRSSGSPTAWAWDFDGDGTVDSTLQNPRHVYTTPGDYTVELVARNANTEGSKRETAFVHVTGPVQADFTATPTTTGGAPLTVLFRDTSTEANGAITAWAWDFDGNGTTDSTQQNPAHTYTTPGTFTVSLTATGQNGSNTVTRAGLVTVSAPGPLVAGFTSVVTASPLFGRTGTAVGSVYDDETITFTDTSTGTVSSRLWNFGDGTTATGNPVTKSFAPGTYDVFLTVTGPDGTDSEVKPALITAVGGSTTVVLGAVQDNSIYNDPQVVTSTDHSNSALPQLVTGKAALVATPFTNHGLRRALVRFDLSSIPPSSVVQSATLQLTCSLPFSNPTGDQPVAIHRLQRAWGEVPSALPGGIGGGIPAVNGEATWTAAIRGSVNWTAPGGDFVPTASATTTVGNVIDIFPDPPVPLHFTWATTGNPSSTRADAQAWVADPTTNHGWILRSNEAGGVTSRTTKVFDSRENPTAANRPRLTVVFRPPLP